MDFRNGDCVKGMAAMKEKSVDVVITSPPYNLDIAYGKYRDNLGREEFLDWCVKWASEVKRVLRDDGSFFLNVGASSRNPYLPHELVLRLRPLFALQNTLHWVKSITIQPTDGSEISAGHFKPLNSEQLSQMDKANPCCEDVAAGKQHLKDKQLQPACCVVC